MLCLSGCSGAGEESDTGTSDEKTEKAAEAEDPEKKYEVVYLDMSKEEKTRAQERLAGLMEDCREIYAGAEKAALMTFRLRRMWCMRWWRLPRQMEMP